MVLDDWTKLGKVGLLLWVVGAVLYILGFGLPFWFTNDNGFHLGLWLHCMGSVCGRTTGDFFGQEHLPGWYRWCQVLSCLAVVVITLAFLARVVFIVGKKPIYLLLSVGLDCAITALSFMVATIFGNKVEQSASPHVTLSWGFAVDILGGVLFVCSAAFCLVEFFRRRSVYVLL